MVCMLSTNRSLTLPLDSSLASSGGPAGSHSQSQRRHGRFVVLNYVFSLSVEQLIAVRPVQQSASIGMGLYARF